jgi:methionyl-tRNA synthetase
MTDHQDRPAARRYYITTAIDYSNGVPHLGHSLEKIAADVLARYHRLLGNETLFSMGLDENSQHVARAADERGVERRVWIDTMDEAFRQVWRALDISYDAWIRTTEERHVRASQEMFRRAQERGDIYRASYAGWYCPNCNTYYLQEELVEGHCPNHPSVAPEWLEEENYFFALTKYSERLQRHIEEHPDFIVPANRRAEVLGLIRQGLRDFSVSRRVRPGTTPWGIPVPGDPEQVLYVWFDALTNYLTSIGFLDDEARFARFWPADAHVIGKDVVRFHCLYWPAMLWSAGLPLPRQVPVHGFLSLNGQRFSKSAGNTIDVPEVVAQYGADAVRYHLLRNLSFASDADFTLAGLQRSYHDELANDLGNLLNRVVSMLSRYRSGAIPAPAEPGPLETELQQAVQEGRMHAEAALERWELNTALAATWNVVRRANRYIEQHAPWKLARQPGREQELDTVLYSAAEVMRLLAILLTPYIPSASERLLAQLGQPAPQSGDWRRVGNWGACHLTRVAPGPLLFPRIELSTAPVV